VVLTIALAVARHAISGEGRSLDRALGHAAIRDIHLHHPTLYLRLPRQPGQPAADVHHVVAGVVSVVDQVRLGLQGVVGA